MRFALYVSSKYLNDSKSEIYVSLSTVNVVKKSVDEWLESLVIRRIIVTFTPR